EQKASATADDKGKWSVKLPAVTAVGPIEVSVAGENTLTLKDVLVGDVWVCSGQSNMQWTVSRSNNPEQEIAAADHPKLRLFQVPLRAEDEPQTDVNTKWTPCTPATIPNFSAVAYFFGRSLQEKHPDVPIG